MNNDSTVVFVCEHGAAKSVIAAAHFNRLAAQMGLDLHAVARGTNPDRELAPQAIDGLLGDGLSPVEAMPQLLTVADIQTAQRVIVFCELPSEVYQQGVIERWNDIPPVSENYEKARDDLLERMRQLLNG